MQQVGKFNHGLAAEGKLIWADILKPSSDGARVLTDASGTSTVQKGPFTDKVAGGYALISAGSLDEVLELVKTYPSEPNTGVEIRQVMSVDAGDYGNVPASANEKAKMLRQTLKKNIQAYPDY